MAEASLTPAVFVLRLHPVGQPPAPYVGSATVVARGDTAEVLGLTLSQPWTRELRDAARAALKAAGFRWAVWERRDGEFCRAVRRAV